MIAEGFKFEAQAEVDQAVEAFETPENPEDVLHDAHLLLVSLNANAEGEHTSEDVTELHRLTDVLGKLTVSDENLRTRITETLKELTSIEAKLPSEVK